MATLAQQTIAEALRLALNLPQGTPAFVLALYTFGEYLDFHPHIHALVADGLLDVEGNFHLAPEIPDKVLSELFRKRVFKELLSLKLIPRAHFQDGDVEAYWV